jgi:hypothetical protein
MAVVDEIWIADTATFGEEKNSLCFTNREDGATECAATMRSAA